MFALRAVSLGLLSLMAWPAAAQETVDRSVDPGNSTWHVGLDGLWGRDTKRNKGRNLDFFAAIVDHRWVNAVGSARSFNTSLHFVRESDVVVDPESLTFAGTVKTQVTPDTWIPSDGQAFEVVAAIDGQLVRQDDGFCG